MHARASVLFFTTSAFIAFTFAAFAVITSISSVFSDELLAALGKEALLFSLTPSYPRQAYLAHIDVPTSRRELEVRGMHSLQHYSQR